MLIIWTKDYQSIQRSGCSHLNAGANIWKVIWGLQVPNVTKMFLWKEFNNLLSTKENLFHRRVVDGQLCPICTIEVESVVHILWECPSTMDVWSFGPGSLQKCGSGAARMSRVLEAILKRCTSAEIEFWAVLTRKIWLKRNSVGFGRDFIPPNQLVQESHASLEDFRGVTILVAMEEDTCSLHFVDFPPLTGLYKANWNAAIDIKNGRIGVSIIARDSWRQVVVAHSLTISALVDSVVVEAWAASHAVLFAKETGLLDLILKGDAFQVVNQINAESSSLSGIGHFTEGIKFELHSQRSSGVIHV